jgi:hypothetical protein
LSETAPKLPVEVPPELENKTEAPPLMRLFPAASLPVSVTVALEPELTVELVTAIVDVDAEMAPGVTVMVGNTDVTVFPSIVALIVVAVPERIPVKLAVKVPLLLFVTAENEPVEVPPLRLKTIVELLVVKLFPAASLAVKVTSTLEPELTELDATVTSDCVVEIVPGVTVMLGLGVEVTGDPLMVPLMVVAVPARTPVKVEV